MLFPVSVMAYINCLIMRKLLLVYEVCWKYLQALKTAKISKFSRNAGYSSHWESTGQTILRTFYCCCCHGTVLCRCQVIMISCSVETNCETSRVFLKTTASQKRIHVVVLNLNPKYYIDIPQVEKNGRNSRSERKNGLKCVCHACGTRSPQFVRLKCVLASSQVQNAFLSFCYSVQRTELDWTKPF